MPYSISEDYLQELLNDKVEGIKDEKFAKLLVFLNKTADKFKIPPDEVHGIINLLRTCKWNVEEAVQELAPPPGVVLFPSEPKEELPSYSISEDYLQQLLDDEVHGIKDEKFRKLLIFLNKTADDFKIRPDEVHGIIDLLKTYKWDVEEALQKLAPPSNIALPSADPI